MAEGDGAMRDTSPTAQHPPDTAFLYFANVAYPLELPMTNSLAANSGTFSIQPWSWKPSIENRMPFRWHEAKSRLMNVASDFAFTFSSAFTYIGSM